ncbi:MAG: dephospho-CoA kinase [Bacteroidaceae bacterium]|nr:dephospho-CoA kinase [Bacteroidaceae bacterium]
MPHIIGLTGGIGSGKSFIARRMEQDGALVYYSDSAAKHLIESDPSLQAEIAALLGDDVFADGVYQTKIVSSRVFAHPTLLHQLNAIVHPAVLRDIRRWIAAHADTETLVIESAILFESGIDALCDEVVCVSAPEEVCIARVMARDHVTEEAVRARMARQMPDDERRKRSNRVIINQ